MPVNVQPAVKKTVAFFSSSPGGSFLYEKWQMWRGIAETARELDLNLIYVAGEAFENSPQATLYQLINQSNASGIIFWHPFLGPYTSRQKFQDFFDQYRPLPIVGLEIALKGCASILLDIEKGVRDILAHLVEEHNYQKIAFLYEQNSVTANQRREVYERVMHEYGLFDPRFQGNQAELDERGLMPGKDYQAIIAQSDDQAVRAVETFRQRGFSVPEDVAVAGFNDGFDARGSLPPLTTLRIPFRHIGRQAVEMLAAQMDGTKNIEQRKIPLQLVTRRSCGCLEPMAEGAALGTIITSQRSLFQVLDSLRPAILSDMTPHMGTPIETLAAYWAEDLLDTFIAEFEYHAAGHNDAPSRIFLEGLSELLHKAIAEGSNISRWHEALTIMRRHLLPYLDRSMTRFAEDLWQQARVLLGQTVLRAEIHNSWRSAARTDRLRDMQAQLQVSTDESELLRILSDGLPDLGIESLFLVQYKNGPDPKDDGRLLLVYKNGQTAEPAPDERHFPLHKILPDRWVPDDGPCCMLIEALHLRDEEIGYLVFITAPPDEASECDTYQALRVQISSALKGVGLRQELSDALRQAEEANLLKSQFLSMVSHELRTPLNLIVGLSEMALRQKSNGLKNSLEVLRNYHEQIYISGQHLDRLIRDVLDLASSQIGQMKLTRKPIDLTPVLQDAACMASQLADQKKLDFIVEIPKTLPPVYGDKTRLRQVLLNLLSNAVKFTARGEITLKAGTTADNEITITVKDTGLGIPKEEQQHIFDEFSQSSRTAVRGFGGIGLGLAITRMLVEMHGGSIWVSSNGAEGQGSTFTFSLPVMTTAVSIEQEPSIDRQSTVLILSQRGTDAKSLFNHLNKQGFNVELTAIENQADVMENIKAAPPGAIVLDMAPAAERGWEIMHEIKQNPATLEIPVLFYSLMVEKDTGSVLDVDYLTKPIGTKQLTQALKRLGLGSQHRVIQSVLIIDDEPGILELHSSMLQSELPNCQILKAQDGKQGLELMREFLPDLVLLDLMMPIIDGFEVLKAMQSEQALSRIPVIVLSGQTLDSEDMKRLNKSMATVLKKGIFTSREILDRIQDSLSRNRRLGTEAQRLVHQAMAYIHENYRESLVRRNIADHLCVNEQYLSRCFSKEIGIGPMTYLSRYRIEQAKRLLEKGEFTITHVALEVGFSSQSYFSRLFQKEMGITPSAYQRGERPSRQRQTV